MIDILPIPAFDDNYIWLLTRPGYTGCAVVDPGDEDPVIERLRRDGLHLDAVLVTHKHGDHVGGVRGLKAVWPDAVVYGPANEPIRSVVAVNGDVAPLSAQPAVSATTMAVGSTPRSAAPGIRVAAR